MSANLSKEYGFVVSSSADWGLDLCTYPMSIMIASGGICAVALAGKFKKWSKNLGSVLKRCEYDVRSTKKNLGSIGGSLEEPQPKHVHWCLAQRFSHCR